jgi:hypothetical protein
MKIPDKDNVRVDEFNAALDAEDVQWLAGLFGYNHAVSPLTLLIIAHKVRYESPEFTPEHRIESRAWLTVRNINTRLNGEQFPYSPLPAPYVEPKVQH